MSEKDNQMTYTDEAGNQVFTSTYLQKRGTCCKTNCLHCPYGFTLKNYSIEIVPMNEKQIKFANTIISDSKPVELSPLSASILAGAFGKKEKIGVHHITEDNYSDFAFGQFKGVICSVIEFSKRLSESTQGRAIKNLYLKKEFQNQGLGIEHIIK